MDKKKLTKKDYWKIILLIIIVYVGYSLLSNYSENKQDFKDYKICIVKCMAKDNVCMIEGGILRHQDTTDVYIECNYDFDICVSDCEN